MTRPVVRLLGWLVPIAMFGCGAPPQLTPITGVVFIDGQPVEGNTEIVFLPMQDTPMAAGRTDEDGWFTLADAQNAGGLRPGIYKVVIANSGNFVRIPQESSDNSAEPDWEKYRQDAERIATRPPTLGIVPKEYANGATTPLRYRIPEDGPEARFLLKSGVAPVRDE